LALPNVAPVLQLFHIIHHCLITYKKERFSLEPDKKLASGFYSVLKLFKASAQQIKDENVEELFIVQFPYLFFNDKQITCRKILIGPQLYRTGLKLKLKRLNLIMKNHIK
jgi:hypothetical protein